MLPWDACRFLQAGKMPAQQRVAQHQAECRLYTGRCRSRRDRYVSTRLARRACDVVRGPPHLQPSSVSILTPLLATPSVKGATQALEAPELRAAAAWAAACCVAASSAGGVASGCAPLRVAQGSGAHSAARREACRSHMGARSLHPGVARHGPELLAPAMAASRPLVNSAPWQGMLSDRGAVPDASLSTRPALAAGGGRPAAAGSCRGRVLSGCRTWQKRVLGPRYPSSPAARHGTMSARWSSRSCRRGSAARHHPI
jgi:hypothetical protein